MTSEPLSTSKGTTWSDDRCLHELFAEWAVRTPNAVALVFGADRLTYAELDARANQVAQRLRRHEVGPHSLVGLCVERGIEFVVGLLGILKAGAAYVPLDPAYPAGRLAVVLADAAPSVVVTMASLEGRLPLGTMTLVRLDSDWTDIAELPATQPESAVTADSLACVLYTSGSTGTPKGVQTTHRATTRVVKGSDFVDFGAWHTWLQAAPISWDAAVFELWAALANGGVCVLQQGQRPDPDRIVELVDEHRVTAVFLSTSLFNLMIDEYSSVFARLRRVVFGGEVASGEHLRKALATFPRLRMVNAYGPVESMIFAATQEIGEDDLDGDQVPIGRAIANTRLHVLNDLLEPVPPGTTGELFIGGDGLAMGYCGRPEATAERFVASPFHPGERLYRTGDLALSRADGVLVVAGRVDDQVKIRGFRVEPGEVEAALTRHAAVARVAVVPRRDGGHRRLVAYVVPSAAKTDLDAGQLRAFLGESLPDYMIPSAIVTVDRLPLTPTGKLDRAALPAVDVGTQVSADYLAPRTPTERVLARVLAEILDVERVGVHDNFFELGGDSITAMLANARLQRTSDIRVSFQDFFSAPTVAGLAATARGNAERKADWDLAGAAPRLPSGEDEPAPMSFAQQRLWYLAELHPGDVTYHVPLALRLDGDVHQAALGAALTRLVARHESLRTTFDGIKGRGVQVVGAPFEVPIRKVELSGQEGLDEVLHAEIDQPFDLRGGPLVRALLVRQAPRTWLLLLTMHHIITDGWSMGVLAEELGTLYNAAARDLTGPAPVLPELPVRYKDFAMWQRDRLADPARDTQLEYWRRKLAGLTPLALPTDRARPAVWTSAGAEHRFTIPPDLTDALRELARTQESTLFAVLVAAADVVLARLSGQDDVAVGTVVAGRDRPDLQRLVGFFANTVILRSRVDPSLPFSGFLSEVTATVRGALAHSDTPFDRVVQALRPERAPGHNPLVQVVVVQQNAPMRPPEFAGLRTTVHPLRTRSVMFDLVIEFAEDEDGLHGVLRYSTDLFGSATVERMAALLGQVLTSVAAEPTTPITRLDPLPEKEGTRLETRPAVPTLARLFEAQARTHGDRIAVGRGVDELSYAELNAAANRFARVLVRAGVGPEDLVALLLPRTPEMVVAILGVLKAGAAFVPIDPAYPDARIDLILRDTQPATVVREGDATRAADALRREGNAASADLTDAERVAPHSEDNAAYVIYTSGSTGGPKGVVVSHRNVVRLFAETRQLFGFGPADVWTLFHSYAFDFSVWEMWGALLHGGRLVMVPTEVARSPEDLLRLLYRQRVTVLNQTPSAFNQLARVSDDLEPEGEFALRVVIFGGEKLDFSRLTGWLSRHPAGAPRLVNMYGITETTVHVTHQELDSGLVGSATASVIGTAIPGTHVHLLDSLLRPVPDGTEGEMYVAGPGVARGYLGRTGTTASRFVANPFGPPGSRMYRTGDLARRIDSRLEYLGRADDQVKIRGYRVEPGEVAAAMLDHPAVSDAVVLPRGEGEHTSLVAYVVVTGVGGLPAHELHAFASARLPGYLVPSAFVVVDQIPLTPNGKVDRAALPAPDRSREARPGHVAPGTAVEKALARIWGEVLGVDEVGTTDNFFELGGDSIVSLQVVSRARQVGLPLTAQHMLRAQTIAEVAAVMTEGAGTAATAQQGTVSGPVLLTPIQHWFFDHQRTAPEHHNQFVVMDVPDPIHREEFGAALRALVTHHDALRMRYDQVDGQWEQYDAATERGELVAYHDVRTRDEAAEDKVAEAARMAFNLSTGPLLRALVIERGPGRPTRLVLVAHHLVVDAVSWRVILADLDTAYRSLLDGAPVDLGVKTTSYQEWASRLAVHTLAGGFDGEVDYWAEVCGERAFTLPRDGTGPNDAASERAVTVRLGRADTERLLSVAPSAYRTRINDLLLTALSRVLAGWCGSESVLVDLEGHGREEILDSVHLDRTVGWFTTIFPVCLDVAVGGEWEEAITSVQRRLGEIPSRGVGYGALRYLAGHDRLSGAAAPPVSFNYLGRWDTDAAGTSRLGGRGFRIGLSGHPGRLRTHEVEVVGGVYAGELELTWTYSAHLHHEATISRLAEDFRTALLDVVAHCAEAVASERVVPDSHGETAPVVVDTCPLGPTQQGMLFHSLFQEDENVYQAQITFVLDGVTDPHLLAQAWQQVADAVPALRTALRWKDTAEPVQVVYDAVPIPVRHDDWTGLSATEQDERLKDLLASDRITGFDLAVPPLTRLVLARISPAAVRVVWTSHMALLDGWSTWQVLSEVCAAYARLTGTHPVAAPVRRRPYADYLRWLDRQDLEAVARHWRETLTGLNTTAMLPYDRSPGDSRHTLATEKIRFELPHDSTRRLEAVARANRLTLNTVVQGMWALMLARYSGGAEVVFGATVSGRSADLDGIESMLGVFVNTLPVRVTVEPGMPVAEWLRRLQDEQAEARRFEHLSLARIQAESGLPAGTSLFDSAVVFENYPTDERTVARHGLAIRDVSADETTNTPVDLTVYHQLCLSFVLSYDPTLFDESTVRSIAGHLTALLEQVATDLDRKVGELPMLTVAERQRVLVEWNDTDVPPPAWRSVVELFAEQVAAHPHATAVTFEDERLSYTELNSRANQVANLLRERGTGPEDPIGICVDRGLAMVTGILGILKAGATYVPLDPEYPPNRLAFMASDSGTRIVLTRSHLVDRLPDGVAFVCLDDDPDLARQPVRDVSVEIPPERLAYIIYTSGSTGEPKGVEIEHGNLFHIWHSWDVRYGLTELRPKIVSVAGISVDMFFTDIVRSLLFGGELFVCPTRTRNDPAGLLDLIDSTGATAIELVPTLATLVAREASRRGHGLESLRLFTLGSEGWRVPDCRALLAVTGRNTLVANAYGATECTVDATVFCPAEHELADFTFVPIGAPMANTRVYVLDQWGQPLPPGVPGELYIGGNGVARGYHNRAELTARRFVVASFGTGERLYRTGDRVRWLPTGDLEFLGRVDDQVKVRGFRIELGEVEAALLRHPGVAETVVVRKDDGNGSARLVAYVTAADQAAPDTSDLREFLGKSLPDYMVPSAFFVLAELPRTPNGKVDKQALPVRPDRPDLRNQFVPARTRTEAALADVVAEVLGIDRVGVTDNFFDLGGDSILSIRVVSRILAEHGVELTPRALFDCPTVGELAALVEGKDTSTDETGIPKAPRDGSPPPMSFAQQRLWFFDEFEPNHIDHNSYLVFRLQGDLDLGALRAALTGVVARHETLRTRFDAVDGRGVQLVMAAQGVDVPVADLSDVPVDQRDDRLSEVLLDELRTPFDLREGPPMRVLLVRTAPGEHVLVISAHHIVTDGWSMSLLASETGTLYDAALSEGTGSASASPALPPLPVQYVDFAVWQRNRLSDAVLAGQLSFWRRQLDGISPLELPTDRPRPAVRTSAGAVHRFTIASRLAGRLEELGRGHGASLFMVLTAAVEVLLARWSRQRDIAVGTVTSGRDRTDIERLIGCFVNTVVLRSDVDIAAPFTDFLASVRDTTLDAFANAEVPFERVVEALQPARDPSRHPLVQAMVVLQNAPATELSMTGMRVEELDVTTGVTDHELIVEFEPRPSGLVTSITYNRDLFDPDTIERLAAHLIRLLDAIVEDPSRPSALLPWMSDDERDQVLVRWNETSRPVPSGSVLTILAGHVGRAPDAVAVVAGDEELTYAGLDAWANALAHRLADLGVRPDQPVGVLLERSAELVVAVVAIAKAGGACLPLDVRAPAGRMRTQLAAAGVTILVTDRAYQGMAREIHSGHTLEVVPGTASVPPGPPPHPESLLSVLYTSGSTGTPKGVALRHRDVVALASDQRLSGHDRILLHSPPAFDAVTYEVWVPLLIGGTTVVAPPGDTDADLLRKVIGEHRVSAMWLTAGLFRLIAQEAPGSFTGLREIWTGGDVVPSAAVRRVLEACPGLCVVDGYGPTETTTFATSYPMRAPGEVPDVVPIGTPIDNVRTYVLDTALRPVPIGVAGELFIAGEGVARGYLNQPGQTAGRFVANPFGGPGDRMYRTGDVVRWKASGVLEFIGRDDGQVKIRGFRVELGEIEAALAAHPAVASVVTLVKEIGGQNRLVGYVVPGDGARPDPAELRTFLAERLASYMIPAAFVVLDELPVTANGKVDRRALPDPRTAPQPAADRVQPRNATEHALATVWSEVLQVSPVGVTDNFFELGGDSILSIQVASRARAAGLGITTKDIFLRQTIAELAEVAGSGVSATAPGLPPATGPMALTPIQRWFFANHPTEPQHFTMSLLYELDEDVSTESLRRAVDAVVRHHDGLRARFHQVHGEWRQRVAEHEEGTVFEVVHLWDVAGPAIEDFVRDRVRATQSGFDLSSGPLIRCTLFESGSENRPLLSLVAHHLVVDGVSWRILLADLDRAYRRIHRGETADLGTKTTSVRQWASRLVEHAVTGGFDADLDYWRAARPEGVAAVPADAAGANTVALEQSVTMSLDAESTGLLLRAVPRAYRTQINDVLLAALARALCRWTGGHRVCVRMEGHGREDLFDDIDLSGTVGWFTTNFPITVDIPESGTWAATIKSVKERLRSVPGKGLGYDALRYLGPPDWLGEGPQPEISFNYLGRFDAPAPADGIFRRRREVAAQDQHPGHGRMSLIDVVAMVENDRLGLELFYSSGLHRAETIRKLGEDIVAGLREIIRHCTSPDAGGRTPADFPLARLDQAAVDRLAGDGSLVEDIYPLSPMQAGMLFHSVLDTDGGAYFDQTTSVLSGVSDPRLFGQAWQRVVDRHPILRSGIVHEGLDEPMQVVWRAATVPVTYHDWSTMADGEYPAALARLLAADYALGLDLATPPLLRLTVMRLSADRVGMVLTTNHLLLDGWSFYQVFADVFACYRALADGAEPDIPGRPPFRNYLEWLSRQDMTAAAAYWRRTLAGITAPTRLPHDRPGARAHQARAESWLNTRLTAELTDELLAVAKHHRLTMNTLVQGAWALLLSRYSNDEEVVFGATVSGRPADVSDVDSMLGMMLNTLPVRVRVDGSRRAVDWLRELQAAQAEARQFGYVPLNQIQSYADLPPGVPLFESLVVFENYPVDEAGMAGQGVLFHDLELRNSSNFPLNIVVETRETLSLSVLHDSDLIDARTAARVADQLTASLAQFAYGIERPLAALRATNEMARQSTVDRRRTAAESTATRYVHECLAEHAVTRGDAVALVFGDDRMTYAELDARANQLARHLASLGVGRGTRVGLCVERGFPLVVGVLGILKAGGAYVPLDPDYPVERLAAIIAEVAAPVVVTRGEIWRPVSAGLTGADPRPVCLDDDWPVISSLPATEFRAPVTPDDVACVLFTSGSSGRPKGAESTHRAVSRVFFGDSDLRFGPDEVWLQSAPVSWDGFLLELFSALAHGGVCVLAPGQVPDPDVISELVPRHGITSVWLSSSLFNFMVEDNPGFFAFPRQVLTGGEIVSGPHALKVLEQFPDLRLVNVYGPVENTVFATTHRITAASCADGSHSPPVGRPVGGTRVFLLDRWLTEVPTGVAGEVYLAGDGLARGYANSPDLTAQRFVANPFEPGKRLYRTGDLVRRRPDGELEFVGRTDDQVKIRGYRVEPREVEAALVRHPGVAQAAVVARAAGGHQRLVAYVVLSPAEPGPDPAALRDYLGTRLPEYLIPPAFVTLDRLPLTANGKLDSDALPAWNTQLPERVDSGAPRNATEERLVRIWADVLGTEHAGVRDNFFELGGDSILAMRVTSRIHAEYGVKLSPRALFDTPTIAGIAGLLPDGGTPRGHALLEAAPRDEPVPLSFAQQRLWFLHQVDPASTEYNSYVALRIEGDLEVAALRTAVGRLVTRHESMRTSFMTVGGEGVQVVGPPQELPVPVTDLSGLTGADQEAELGRLLRAEAERPFDLSVAPLVRASLVRLGAAEHIFMLCMHHIVTDGWSMEILTAELGAYYRSATEGTPVALPEPAVRYADYAVWQRASSGSDSTIEQSAYWREQLAGLTPLELPTDRPRPPVRTTAGAVCEFEVPAPVRDRLRGLGLANDATLFMVLMAAAQVLFARYSRQRDVAVGTVTSGRERAELERVVGFFVNTLVIRSDVDPDRTFADFLADVRDTLLNAFANAELPFDRLVEQLQPDRDASRTPLIQAMVMLNPAHDRATLPGLRVAPARVPVTPALFDLALSFTDFDDRLVGEAMYNTDLFDADTIERLVGHLGVLLAAVADDPERPVSLLPLLTEPELRLFDEWNDTAVERPGRVIVHERVAAHAVSAPDRVAVTCQGSAITYAELDARANQLANYLIDHGVGSDAVVGVCLERSPEMIVGMLAVVKTGAAYLPLDPDYPPDRIAFILGDAAAPFVLIQHRLADRIRAPHTATLCLDTEWPSIERFPAAPPEVEVDPRDVAYVVYTSGSTGQPKGVLIEHRSLTELCLRHNEVYRIGPDDRAGQVAALGFDATVLELWPYLVAGARIDLPGPRDLLDARALVDWFVTAGTTACVLPTPRVDTVLDEPALARTSLRLILIGGDVLRRRPSADMRFRVINNYGPSEATVLATSGEVEPAGGPEDQRLPSIGRPVDNMRCHVLDAHRNPVPIGVPGELYLSGTGLARGYLGRPDLTEERFVRLPFGGGERAYRTGDLGRWRSDGTLEFVGRADDQVKIRGFRIELGEIEAALLRHESVAEAVVVAPERVGGGRRLVGYVVFADGVTGDIAAVRTHLAACLPAYMVPPTLVALPELPLDPNGKIARSVLAAREPDAPDRAAYVAPRSPVESTLVRIWTEVLGVDRVGVEDNFFELGGDSILSIQVVSRARENGIALSAGDMLACQTIAEQAQLPEVRSIAEAEQGRVTGAVPLTPIQRWFFAAHGERPDHFTMSVQYEIARDVDEPVLRKALAAVTDHHDGLRTRFAFSEGEWRQYVAPAEPHDVLTVEDLSAASPGEITHRIDRIALAAQSSLDLRHGPLIRAVLVRMPDGHRPRLFVTIHHLVVDVVSWSILVEDLDTAYRRIRAGEPIDLGRKTTSFQQWASKLHAHTEAGGLDDHVGHWREVAGSPATPLPVDRAGANTVASIRTVTVALDNEATEAFVRGVPGRYRARVNHVLLAALGRVLQQWTGGERVLVNLEGHGREDLFDDVDLSRTVGWFTTIFPVALNVPEGDWRGAVRTVSTQLRAVPAHGLSYGALRYLRGLDGPASTFAEHPVPGISFNYLGRRGAATKNDGLFGRLLDGAGRESAGEHRRVHLIDVTGGVVDGKLEFTWIYSQNTYDAETVERLAGQFADTLREIARNTFTS
ncbi:non-ribosomal peptide synthase/polyketide synthase [Amycolatopsis pigmentata]|uniref:Non-ribosomal peptide synthase/polyketide synthase n=1 Tax=Amycolatopsis pigmentata TaxID=450801 RepID=A0ABW5G0I4_9PSEU